MRWECSECGDVVERIHRPIHCGECGVAGPVYVRGEPPPDDVREQWLASWTPAAAPLGACADAGEPA